MTSKMILFVALATACFVERSAALSCPCWWYEPTPEDPRSYSERYCNQNLRCSPEAQIVPDMCGCCDTCSKIKGESCGGPWFHAGVCSDGLVCRDEYGNDPMTMPSGMQREGTCVLPVAGTDTPTSTSLPSSAEPPKPTRRPRKNGRRNRWRNKLRNRNRMRGNKNALSF